MNAERRRQVEKLYETVRDCSPEEQSDVLAQAEPKLRREVESLLLQRGRAGSSRPVPLPGSQLGAYRIEAELGKGGMGQVFRARDPRLRRDVAIKLCVARVSQRFQQEARSLAALNHPNICTIHDVGPDYIVMELVEGETLTRRIRKRPLPFSEALAIARQIASALEAAHEKGIVHRDLKPGNVMVKPDGSVKVLDFGLARNVLSQKDGGETTATMEPTEAGVILGTPAYMAPEQARGDEIDKRADIWSFGVVLYEMLTGIQPFQRGTLTETVAAVLTHAPDWQRVPEPVQRLLRRCLEKNPGRRQRDIGDARMELEELTPSVESDARTVEQPNGGNRSRRARRMWFSLTGLALATAVATFLLFRGGPPITDPITGGAHIRTTILLPPSQMITEDVVRGSGPVRYQLAISPDGKSVVYSASTGGRSQLFIRTLAEFEAKPLPNTHGGNFPVFSPDGRWVAFFSNYRLQKVAVAGGAPISICDVAVIGRGVSWGPADTIVFSAGEPHRLWRVSASGGTPERITTASGGPDTYHSWPHILPDGESVLFSLGRQGQAGLALLSLDTGEWKSVLNVQAKQPRYIPTGHVVYAVEGALRAVAFDLDTLRMAGSPVPVFDPIFDESNSGGTEFAISDGGTLVFLPGGVDFLLVWVDRSGQVTPLTAERKGYRFPALSPDGTQVTVTVDPPDQGYSDIWIYDVTSGTGRRLTQKDHNLFSLWVPDGTRVVWGCRGNICSQSADGIGDQKLLFRNLASPRSFSPDGRWLVFAPFNPATNWDLVAQSLSEEHTRIPIAAGPAREISGAISPDGRWFSFASDESGSSEVYVQHFPGPGRRIRISRGGGEWPVWSNKELFYVNGPQMVAVPVKTGESFGFGKAEVLFEDGSLIGSGGNQRFDVTRDGQRFLMVRDTNRIQGTQLRVVINWFKELKEKVSSQ